MNRLIFRILVLGRYLTLNRQAREIKRIIQGLPVVSQRAVGQLVMTEIEAASAAPQPRLYGSTHVHSSKEWGSGTSEAFAKSQSRVQQLRLRGVSMWLAIVFHETRDSKFPGFDSLHREVLGLLGVLKGTHGVKYDAMDVSEVA